MDTIRNSGGNNIKRLLIIAGAKDDLQFSCSSNYTIPIDKSNKLAVSIHYFKPNDFVFGKYYEPYNWTDDDYDDIITISPTLKWGTSLDYNKTYCYNPLYPILTFSMKLFYRQYIKIKYPLLFYSNILIYLDDKAILLRV